MKHLSGRKSLMVLLILLAALCACMYAAAEQDAGEPLFELADEGPYPVNSRLALRVLTDKVEALSAEWDWIYGGWSSGAYPVERTDDGPIVYITTGDCPDGTTIGLKVSAKTGEEWTGDTEFQVTFYSHGKLAAPEVTLESDTFAIGTPVVVEVSGPESMTGCDVSVINTSTASGPRYLFQGSRFAIPDSWLDTAGSYRLEITAVAEGWNRSDTVCREITVTGELGEGPQIVCNGEEFFSRTGSFTFRCENATEFGYFLEGLTEEQTVAAAGGKADVDIILPPDALSQLVSDSYPLKVRAKVHGVWTQYTVRDCTEWKWIPQFSFDTEFVSAGIQAGPYLTTESKLAFGIKSGYACAVIPGGRSGAEGVFHRPGGFNVKITNGHTLYQRFGTDPKWTVEQVGGPRVSFSTEEYTANEGEWREVLVTLDEYPQSPMDIRFRITCEWEGRVSFTEFVMRMISVAIPTGNTIPDTIDMQVGKSTDIHFDFDPPQLWGQTKTEFIFAPDEDGYIDAPFNMSAMYDNKVTPLKPGYVQVTVILFHANLMHAKTVRVRIADEDGVFPEEKYTVNVYGDENGEAFADPASGTAGTRVRLTAVPHDGYQLKEWTVLAGNVTVTDNEFVIGTENVVIQAAFEEIPEPVAAPVDLSGAKVTAIKDQVYTGKAIKPKITVKLDGVKLRNGTDYKVTYKNNKAVGMATVTVTGKGGYTGTVKASFKINPKPIALSSVKSARKQQLTVKWKKGSGITGYEIQYSLKKDFKSVETVRIRKASTTGTVLKVKSKKTYYVRIRTYKTVKGKKYYSAWSKALKTKVK